MPIDIAQLGTLTLVPWDSAHLHRCDPYLVWADVAGRLRRQRPERCDTAVLVELRKSQAPEALAFLADPGLFVPNGAEPGHATRFVTGVVSRAGLAHLVQLVMAGHVERFALQQAGSDTGGVPVQPPTASQAKVQKHQAHPPQSVQGTYLGVIDDGFPFARARALLVAGAQRRVHLWDQGWEPGYLARATACGPRGKPVQPGDRFWQLPWEPSPAGASGFFYGRKLQEAPTFAAGGDVYAQARYMFPAPRETHGASVLGLLAPWLLGGKRAVDWPDRVSGLALVQLPTRTVDETSGSSLAVRVLDGLRFVLWCERMDRGGAGKPRPTVVNISYGVHTGPHDGTSLLEQALREALDENDHLRLALPAGNAHRAGCHALRTLGAKASTALQLWVLPDNRGETHVEVWVPGGKSTRVSVQPPAGAARIDVEEGQAKVEGNALGTAQAVVRFSAVYPDAVAHGLNGTMTLVSIGPTRHACHAAAPAPSGLWQIGIENLTDDSIDVNAWIARDDAPPDRDWGSRQAWFPDEEATREGTLNGIATFDHDRLKVVGAMRVDGTLAGYSAANRAGATGPRDAPHAVAPADWSLAVPGLRTMGFAPGARTRINGTSAACAVYARYQAFILGFDPPLVAAPPKPPPRQPEKDDKPAAPNDVRGGNRGRRYPVDA